MKSVIRKDEAAVSPVIATILMVAITVVLAAVLYVMVSGLITPVGGTKPLVEFGSVDQSDGNATFDVLSATQSVAPTNYKVNLRVSGVTGTAQTIPSTSGSAVSFTISGTQYRIVWNDLSGGTLNAGDEFRVTGNGAPLPAGSYTFFLLWNNNDLIKEVPWTK